ncbi:MAG: undecaprenyl diphosphate synthase family protein [Candidatus Nomurabacteria bacterium]|jgi:undecaprenyl diphosphate synthase|nr:undecaprenyl diphosphate synthase family protein [Candidatus Nomurabacteria bacterium]
MDLALKHLALIPDGNRRWGRARGIKMSVDFYVQSGLLGLDLARRVFDRGIDKLTIWIGSLANLTKRSALEIKALNKAYQKFFTDPDNLKFAHQRKIKIDCFGRWHELLTPKTVQAIDKTVTETAKYTDSGKRLTVLIAYDGADERGAALKKILAKIQEVYAAGGQRADDFFHNELPDLINDDSLKLNQTLRQFSWTGHLPDVDLIVRTGSQSDPHNSAGFLSMLADNAQLAFTDTLWPDFSTGELDQILDNYSHKERRLGK